MAEGDGKYFLTTVFISTVGLICNAVSFSFFIKKRKEFGNVLLAYLNIVDIFVSLSVFLYFVIATSFQSVVISAGLKAVSVNVFRNSIVVTGLITMYLNILRTSAIIWPMFKFRRRAVHGSLILLITASVGLEACIGIIYTYPKTVYLHKLRMGVEASPPLTKDHPFVLFYNFELLIFGILIIFLVTVCCLVSAVKLLTGNKHLQEVEESGDRVKAAITVLILGLQYVVCNTIGLTLISICVHYNLHGGRSETFRLRVNLLGITSLVLNSTLHPIVYICRVKKLRLHFLNLATCSYFKKIHKRKEQHISRSDRQVPVSIYQYGETQV